MKTRVLFVLKYRDDPERFYGTGLSSGLHHSSQMINRMLRHNRIDSHVVHVHDDVAIAAECQKLKPHVVIVEDVWISPERLDHLTKLNGGVTWIVRLHSEVQFLACQYGAVDWVLRYVKIPNVYVATNSEDLQDQLTELVGTKSWKLMYVPNYYHLEERRKVIKPTECLRIGCFGAVRPMKNHLQQAIAAIQIGEEFGLPIEFHINATRVENGGDAVLSNLRGLFGGRTDRLVEHSWMDHKDFLKVCATMDLGMQCSLTETFNVVSADMVSRWVPVVGSSIPWLPWLCTANPKEVDSIVDTGITALNLSKWGIPQRLALRKLKKHNAQAENIWVKTIETV